MVELILMMYCTVPNRLIAAALIVMVAGCGTATETIAEGDRTLSPAAQAQLSANLSQWVAEYQAQDEIPGVAVALVINDEILLLETWGDRDLAQQLPVTPQTLFHIGSTHKSMTALLGAIAVDRGLLAWDAPLVETFPELTLADPDATENLTLRHLLSMRSGIHSDAEDDFEVDTATPEDLADYIADLDLFSAPGDQFSYSNLSVSLAGYLIALAERPDQDPFPAHAALLQSWILDPIGMDDAVLQRSDALRGGNVAIPYRWDDTEGDWVTAEPEDFDDDVLAPSGGLKASVEDMAAYLITQVQGGVTPGGDRIVSAANLAATWEPRWGTYAMGWEVADYPDLWVLHHEGLYDNQLSIIGLLPDYGLGFVVLTNSAEAAENLIADVTDYLVEQVERLED
ncbi:serine hydrolase domain-containing protein [Spirulina major]|uniref:serine hydrolase domain-containing protein n=1 Tax=Spirulina major TaxID=270636 RepID=UPI001587AF2E|nr:serine hydrolase domain-containing protein [Spirulina major]